VFLTIAEIALWIALPVSIWGGVLAFLGAKWKEEGLARAGEWTLPAVAALLVVASVGLAWALLGDRFEVAYVHAHSSRNLEPWLKVGALWVGRQGGLLFWLLCLALVAWPAARNTGREDEGGAPWLVGTLLGFLAFLLAVTLFLAPPFQELEVLPPQGDGLAPRLQSGWLLVQGPLVFVGLAVATLPCARALGALLSGRVEGSWTFDALRWLRVGWLLLTGGILAGMRWAWESRGWEGSWVLDPVENGTLITWIVAGVLLHLPWARRKGGGEGAPPPGTATLALLCLLFLTTIPSALLLGSAPSGSGFPHPGDARVATAFAAFVTVAGGGLLVLVLWRLPAIRSGTDRRAPGPAASRTRLGERLAHGGAVVLALGLLGGIFVTEVEEFLLPGEAVEVASPLGGIYSLTYQGLSTHQGRNAWHLIGLLTVRREGRPVGSLTPERLGVFIPPGPVPRPDARSRHPLESVQAVMVELDEAVGTGNVPEHQGATFRIRILPLAPWIWYGGAALLLGGILTLGPGRSRRPFPGEGGEATLPSIGGPGAHPPEPRRGSDPLQRDAPS
jgi:cytochrome c biogenesis factor